MTPTKKIFAPGQAAGPSVAGTGLSSAALAGRKPPKELAQVQAPRGEQVAKQYPWMASIRMDHGVALNSYTKFMRTNGEPGFYNAQRRRIYIDEVRIFAAPRAPEDGARATFDIELARHVGVKLSKQTTRYIDRFIPLWNINTERNRLNQWMKFNGIFKLPTQYYLQRGSIFTMRTRLDTAMPGIALPYAWSFGLHGKDVVNDVPYSLLKTVNFPVTEVTDPVASTRLTVFDENRDVPLQDCAIDIIALGVCPVFDLLGYMLAINSIYYAFAPLYANTSFQFQPPEGPQWHTNDDWFPFQSLLYQPGLYIVSPLTHYYCQANHVIHRPITPYILDPREEFMVELETLDTMTYNPTALLEETTLPIYCTLFGRQEALS